MYTGKDEALSDVVYLSSRYIHIYVRTFYTYTRTEWLNTEHTQCVKIWYKCSQQSEASIINFFKLLVSIFWPFSYKSIKCWFYWNFLYNYTFLNSIALCNVRTCAPHIRTKQLLVDLLSVWGQLRFWVYSVWLFWIVELKIGNL